MLGSEILEVAIGLIFLLLLVSTLISALREAIETFVKSRAAHLDYGIRLLLNDPQLSNAVYEHPLIYGLFEGEYVQTQGPAKQPGPFEKGGTLPSYIPSRNFAVALLDVAARGPITRAANTGSNAPLLTADTIRANIGNIENRAVQRVILTALDDARDDLERTRVNIEKWFDSAMDRVSGRYKRQSQKIIFVMALVTAVTLNIDLIRISAFLYHDDVARAAIMARAESASAGTTVIARSYSEALDSLNAMKLPIGGITKRSYVPAKDEGLKGLTYGFVTVQNFLLAVLGWLIVAFAATLGAPFWFDMLNKVMVIRSTVKPAEKSGEEGSEDRKKTTATTVDVTTTPAANAGATMTPAATTSTLPPPVLAYIDEDVEGCGMEGDETLDEELPEARGGVA